ncbi:hypothetical protein RFI_15162 [Reticulomyxa filosa]|uniref:Rab-GAP TBC domain-containing protein n=1 Tax=Reticulomyxa filosa TaxID=46433 RepID=X6N9R4_RETFI|nr:hypothetical protein RFI_15162 [Reticulomyxa filosa]|eukprot:ETO22042.1 hypothetical protein RFI_15162 [Reticulomyxa filosa]
MRKGSASSNELWSSTSKTKGTSASADTTSNDTAHKTKGLLENTKTKAFRTLSKSMSTISKLSKSNSRHEWGMILEDQINSPNPDPDIVRAACKVIGVPEGRRGDIWKILLHVPLLKKKMEEEVVALKKKQDHKEGGGTAEEEEEEEEENHQNEDIPLKHPNSQHDPLGSMAEGNPPIHDKKTEDDGFLMIDAPDSDTDMHMDEHNQLTLHKKDGLTTNILLEPLREQAPALENQRVIQVDIERTRPTLKCFQSQTVRQDMEVILTEYCHRYQVSYKQGMNYILASFFMAGITDRSDLFLCFQSFVKRFLNSTFGDNEFGSLQCLFRLFRLLVQYHEPALSVFLDQYEIVPELFASGWFMTIHANKSDQDTLLFLWDAILLEPNPCFHYFIDLELLFCHKEEILKKSHEELPQFLVNILIENSDRARKLIAEARKTFSNTPLSFHDLFMKCTKFQIRVDSSMYLRLESLPCLPIASKELIGCYYMDILLGEKRTQTNKSKDKDKE